MSRLEGLQRLSVVVAVVCGIFGLATSVGCRVLPEAPQILAWPLHGMLLGLGVAAGLATAFRRRDIEEERRRTLEDPLITQGEQDHAHREAERQRRHAGTAFLLGPLGVAYWLAYHLEIRGEVTPADFFLVTPVVGFLAGLLASRPVSAAVNLSNPDPH